LRGDTLFFRGIHRGRIEEIAAETAYFFHFSDADVMNMPLSRLLWWFEQGNRIAEAQRVKIR
jgi:hypothetical protein